MRPISVEGRVDVANGKFVFSASEAYAIENGKLAYPVKGATLIGNGPDILETCFHDQGNDIETGFRCRRVRQGRTECTGRSWPADIAY